MRPTRCRRTQIGSASKAGIARVSVADEAPVGSDGVTIEGRGNRGASPSTYKAMTYDFLIDSYDSERVKVLSVWSEFKDNDLAVRPRDDDRRGRSVLEHMVHQCVSEDTWFRGMLGIDVGAPPLPERETRLEFIKRYAEDSGKRLERLRVTDERWWEEPTTFFDVRRSRAWVMTRRLTHTSHHRGQQMAMLRMLGRELHSNYGPTADTGGLMQNHGRTIYAYSSLAALVDGETRGGAKSTLPRTPEAGPAVTERPVVGSRSR
jgi:uncharacterized damage-inducible protein DinB